MARLLRKRSQKNPVIVLESDTVEAASKAICKQRQNAALVRNKNTGKVCGIITDADICSRVVGVRKDAKKLQVSEIMTRDPCFVHPSAEVLEVFEIMVAYL